MLYKFYYKFPWEGPRPPPHSNHICLRQYHKHDDNSLHKMKTAYKDYATHTTYGLTTILPTLPPTPPPSPGRANAKIINQSRQYLPAPAPHN